MPSVESRWDDDAARDLAPLDLLVYASRLIGAEPSLALWGGGNTSLKLAEADLRGRPIRVLRVKGSGSDLKSVTRRDFPGVRLDDVLPLLERTELGDQEMVDYLLRCLQEPGSPRPSIETLLHAFLPFEAVIHTHADAVVALTNTQHGHEVVTALYGKEVVSLPYRRPGFRLSREVAEAVRAHPEARGVVLEKHGLLTWGTTLKEAYLGTIDLVTRAEARVREAACGRVAVAPAVPVPDPATRRAVARAVAPVLRGLLGRDRRVILRFDDSADVLALVSAPEAPELTQVGPATPDHTLYTRRLPCFVPLADPRSPEAVAAAVRVAVERFAREYTAYFEAHRVEGARLVDPCPRVVLLPGLGMFAAGRDARTADIVAEIYRHTAWVLRAASAIGRYVSLSAAEAFEVEYWPLELYKLAQAPPEPELARRIALVTGGARGIGRAVARRLAAAGAHVAVADLDEAGAARAAGEIEAEVGPGRAMAIAMDVSSETAVRTGVEAVVEAWGGLDIVVSNAGVAPAAPIDETRLEDWERSVAVNATGHFLVTREALRVLKAQGLGGSLVYVATKNVLAPGQGLAAYSAAKAAEAQLARVAAIEGGPHGIRANVVNPDAVFRDSGLWSDEVRRERARAQGIPVEALEAFYRSRNLLGVSVLPEDVAEAVLFLASDRSAKTTGAMLPVDGGLREAFPR